MQGPNTPNGQRSAQPTPQATSQRQTPTDAWAGLRAGNKAPSLKGTLDTVLSNLRGFGLRVIIHLGAVTAAMGLASSAYGTWQSALAVLGTYSGLICLVARGTALTPAWLIPAISGAGLSLTLGVLGFPLAHALFWGGAQAWVQRLLHKNMRMGTEWAVLPLLIGIAFSWLPYTPLLPLGTAFLVALGLGQVALRLTAFFEAHQIRRAEQMRQAKSNEHATQKADAAAADPLQGFRTSVAALLEKIPALPYTSQGAVRTLAKASNDIVDCMAADPRDHDAGARFLKRYLSAAHTVVDTHIRLVRDPQLTPDALNALADGDKMLIRLGDVFRKEHARLIQNDLTDFSAELRVLDTLLKMDGK